MFLAGIMQRKLGTALAGALLIATASGAETERAGTDFFEKKIRPLLVEQCYQCHSAEAEKLKGGLLLDSREGLLKGGDLGPAVIPGDPEKSLLIKAVRYTDKDLQMPPKKGKLPDRQIADLITWIKLGLPWPGGDQAALALAKSNRPSAEIKITARDRSWWAFQAVRRPPLPKVRSLANAANPIDTFILAELEAKGLRPSPPATKRELIRRAYFDLLGLPPAPETVFAFERDASPSAWERLIDELLAQPQYGERWGRHWLDVARYAQSNGYERDSEKPMAWRYRDYIVRAFNQDKPYDRFIVENLAGDELPDATPDSIVATGFQRLCVWDDEPDDRRMAEFDELDDIISTTGAAFMGLTLGCARCHEHKFDPIPQRDYYQVLAFFRNIRPYDRDQFNLDSPTYVPLDPAARVEAWKADKKRRLAALEAQILATKDAAARKKLESQFAPLSNEPPPFEWALAIRERAGSSVPTHVLIRGNAATPGPEVSPGFLSVLSAEKPALASPGSSSSAAANANDTAKSNATSSAGRRLTFARWLADADNPLTARVLVNRLWQHHFGQGIVKTTTDFGRAGALPTHPRLLDWLAAELVSAGWSLKHMHRVILLSNTYRQSSRIENRQAEQVDPGNDLLWRQTLRRLEAEAVRDSILQVSGQLNLIMGGRGFFPKVGMEVLAGVSRPGLDWKKSTIGEQSRRSIYAYVRRTMPVPAFENFDYNNTSSPLGERPVTTVAPQALHLINDDFVQKQAFALALRLQAEAGNTPEKQVRRGYQLALGRHPASTEVNAALNFLARQRDSFRAISSRLTFRPDVPNSLFTDYLAQLAPTDLLIGPCGVWNYHRGRWSEPYENIRTVERFREPFALATANPFDNGTVMLTLTIDRASEFASILMRATTEADEQRGYEVLLDPRRQRVRIQRHAKDLEVLADTAAPLPVAAPIPLRIDLTGGRLRVWLGEHALAKDHDHPVVDVTDPTPVTGHGCLGVRAWGAPVSLDGLSLRTSDGTHEIHPDTPAAEPSLRALTAFSLLLLNLNEFVYVD